MRVVLALVLLGVSATAVLGEQDRRTLNCMPACSAATQGVTWSSGYSAWADDDDDYVAPVVVEAVPYSVAPCSRRMSSRRAGFRRSLSAARVGACIYVSAGAVAGILAENFGPDEGNNIWEGNGNISQEAKAKIMNAIFQKTMKGAEDAPVFAAVVDTMGIMNPLGAVANFDRQSKSGTVFDMMISKDKGSDRFKFCVGMDLTKNPGGKFMKDFLGEGSLNISHDLDTGVTKGTLTGECANCIGGKVKAFMGLSRYGRKSTKTSNEETNVPAYSKDANWKDRCIGDGNCGVLDNEYAAELAQKGYERMDRKNQKGRTRLGRRFNRSLGHTQNSIGLLGTRAGIKASFALTLTWDQNYDKASCDDACAANGGDHLEKYKDDVGSVAIELHNKVSGEVNIFGNEHIYTMGSSVHGKVKFNGEWEVGVSGYLQKSTNGHVTTLKGSVALGGGDGAGVGVTVSSQLGEATQDTHWAKTLYKNDAVGVRKGRNAGPRKDRYIEEYLDKDGTLRHSLQSRMFCESEMKKSIILRPSL